MYTDGSQWAKVISNVGISNSGAKNILSSLKKHNLIRNIKQALNYNSKRNSNHSYYDICSTDNSYECLTGKPILSSSIVLPPLEEHEKEQHPLEDKQGYQYQNECGSSLIELILLGNKNNDNFNRKYNHVNYESLTDNNNHDNNNMERFDLEQQNKRTNFTTKSRLSRPFELVRKYSLLICILEAIALGLFIYLLLQRGRLSEEQLRLLELNQQASDKDKLASPNYLFYTLQHQSEHKKRFLLDLFPNKQCNLRVHDLNNGAIKCDSANFNACQPVESKQQQNQGRSILPNLELIQEYTDSVDQKTFLDVSAKEKQQVAAPLKATVISTTKAGRRLHRETILLPHIDCKPQLKPHLDPCGFSTRLVVQPQFRYQSILGWGGALTDSSVQNMLSLTTNGTRRLLDDYFGPDGLKYNMIRITIGGSDFSERFYTNDPTTSGDDFNLNNFKLREEDLLYKIPMLKFIQQEYASQWLKLFASMWSPPLWMKTNEHFNQGKLKGSIDSRPLWATGTVPKSELYFNALAELKMKFMLAYQHETSMKFWGLTVMNEPLFAVQPFLNFNTMIFPREDYTNYVAKYLGPKLRSHSELKHVKLIAHDDNRRYLTNFTMPILANPEAKKYIDGVATHSYADEEYNQLDLVYNKYHKETGGSGGSVDRQNSTLNGSEDFFVLPTELCSGHLPFMEKALAGNWHRGMHYGLDIIRSLQHSAAGWVDWNMALDGEGGPGWLGGRLDSPVIVDKSSDSYWKSPMFYTIGQFSRYIPPESVRVQTKVHNNAFDAHFEVVTFALPRGTDNGAISSKQQLATVILNNNPYPIEIKLRVANEQVRSYTTAYYSYTCQADSITTLVYSSGKFQ